MMSLRLKLNLILALLMAVFFTALVVLQVDATRSSVREEIAAANRVAIQVLQRVIWVYARDGTSALRGFLERLGRVRANELTLVDDAGQVLYRSPPTTYKAGREAPEWFSRLVVPPLTRQEIPVVNGKLLIEADASRAVLDGWDDLSLLIGAGTAVFVATNLLVFWILGRTLRAFPVIEQAMRRLGSGDWSVRLPQFAGREAAAIGSAFNGMTEALERNRQAERRMVEAEARLSASRELAQATEQRLEQERAEIARELHDELGQAVTGIRSLAASIVQRAPDPDSTEAARLIGVTAAHLYEAMHGLIPRLQPLTLDSLDLPAVLRDLIGRWRARHPSLQFNLDVGTLPDSAGPTLNLAVYRLIQEAVSNAVRHGRPKRVDIHVALDGPALNVSVDDNGTGLPADSDRPGRFGLRGMRERVAALGGTLRVDNRTPSGVNVTAAIPLTGEP